MQQRCKLSLNRRAAERTLEAPTSHPRHQHSILIGGWQAVARGCERVGTPLFLARICVHTVSSCIINIINRVIEFTVSTFCTLAHTAGSVHATVSTVVKQDNRIGSAQLGTQDGQDREVRVAREGG